MALYDHSKVQSIGVNSSAWEVAWVQLQLCHTTPVWACGCHSTSINLSLYISKVGATASTRTEELLKIKRCVLSHSVVSDSVTPWTAACQALLSMGFSRLEYWSGLPGPPPGSSQPRDRTCDPCIADRFFTTEPPWNIFNKAQHRFTLILMPRRTYSSLPEGATYGKTGPLAHAMTQGTTTLPGGHVSWGVVPPSAPSSLLWCRRPAPVGKAWVSQS